MNPARVVIVTGGTFGIGRAVTLSLAARGHSVVAFGLESAQVSSIAANGIPNLEAELKERGLQATLMEADVSNARDVARVVDKTLEKHGRIDALVNNAAIGPLGTVLDTDEALFDRIMLGPAGIPKEIVVRVSEQIKTSLADNVVRERVRQISCVDGYLDSAGFAAFLEKESARMRDLVRQG